MENTNIKDQESDFLDYYMEEYLESNYQDKKGETKPVIDHGNTHSRNENIPTDQTDFLFIEPEKELNEYSQFNDYPENELILNTDSEKIVKTEEYDSNLSTELILEKKEIITEKVNENKDNDPVFESKIEENETEIIVSNNSNSQIQEKNFKNFQNNYNPPRYNKFLQDSAKIILLKKTIYNIEDNLRFLKSILNENSFTPKSEIRQDEKDEINQITHSIDGVFNGELMIGNDKKRYSVPSNYASKSKLVEGDLLRLNIQQNGTFIYKQLKTVEREVVLAFLKKTENGYFIAETENGKTFRILKSSVSFYGGKNWDKVFILIPKNNPEAKWGAINSLIKQ